MTENELKPCPFCGAKARVNYNIELEPDGVYCNNCKVFVRWPSVKKMNGKETIGDHIAKIGELWNRRTDELGDTQLYKNR